MSATTRKDLSGCFKQKFTYAFRKDNLWATIPLTDDLAVGALLELNPDIEIVINQNTQQVVYGQ